MPSWFWLILVVILTGVYVSYTVTQAVTTSTSNTSTTITTVSPSAISLRGYNYIVGTVSHGTVLASSSSVATALQCGNVMALVKNAIGANYYPSKTKCDVIGTTLLPLQDSSTATLIIPDSSSSNNGVYNNFSVSEVQSNDGVLFCSNVLANTKFAQSLVSQIPEAATYTSEYAPDTYLPMGCIKVASPFYTSLNVSTYSGTRTDSVQLPSALSYQFATTTDTTNAVLTLPNTSLSYCANAIIQNQGLYGSVAAVWDSNLGGTCFLLGTDSPYNATLVYKYTTLIKSTSA